jgi:hypothetical protein
MGCLQYMPNLGRKIYPIRESVPAGYKLIYDVVIIGFHKAGVGRKGYQACIKALSILSPGLRVPLRFVPSFISVLVASFNFPSIHLYNRYLRAYSVSGTMLGVQMGKMLELSVLV